jgi:hypothetical protein
MEAVALPGARRSADANGPVITTQAAPAESSPGILHRINFNAREVVTMLGLMMNRPLLISSILRHADRCHGDTQIVSRSIEGPIHRYTYRDAHVRARRLARALKRLDVAPGERVGTLAWNGYRHFELYYAVSGMDRSSTRSIPGSFSTSSPISSTTRKTG